MFIQKKNKKRKYCEQPYSNKFNNAHIAWNINYTKVQLEEMDNWNSTVFIK